MFVDDLTLLVPENSDISVAAEFTKVQDWAKHNIMVINLSKTKEIIFLSS